MKMKSKVSQISHYVKQLTESKLILVEFEAFLDKKSSIFDKAVYNGQYILASSDPLSLVYLN